MGEHAATLLKMLGDFHDMLMELEKNQKARRQRAGGVRLHGIGDLSMASIESEIGNWTRFTNRRQVASYTGLCPGVSGFPGCSAYSAPLGVAEYPSAPSAR